MKFIARFRNPLVIILLVASGLSAAAGDVSSFIVVATIIAISITLDLVQEVRAEIAVEALRRSVAVEATVRRDGAAISVPVDTLVPGDIVELIAGNLVPADARLIESRDLFVNQALLTGEPYPAEKRAGDAASGGENPAGASNAVFAGTSPIHDKQRPDSHYRAHDLTRQDDEGAGRNVARCDGKTKYIQKTRLVWNWGVIELFVIC